MRGWHIGKGTLNVMAAGIHQAAAQHGKFPNGQGLRSDSVGAGNFDVMDDLWRATDAASLALCDFNKNDVVDVGDFITLGMHFGESSCSP